MLFQVIERRVMQSSVTDLLSFVRSHLCTGHTKPWPFSTKSRSTIEECYDDEDTLWRYYVSNTPKLLAFIVLSGSKASLSWRIQPNASNLFALLHWLWWTGRTFVTDGTFNRSRFVSCCREFVLSGNVQQYPGRRSIWILDGARIHCHPNSHTTCDH